MVCYFCSGPTTDGETSTDPGKVQIINFMFTTYKFRLQGTVEALSGPAV